MSSGSVMELALERFEPNQLILAGQLYREELSGKLSEAAYYKALERYCKKGTLSKAAQGTYYKPKMSKYGRLPLSETEVVRAFTEHDTGMVVGYSLYNSLQLTTQVGKQIQVLTSGIEQNQKTIGRIRLMQCPLEFGRKTKAMVEMLDVLQNYSDIQDLNLHRFFAYTRSFSREYRDSDFEQVYRVRRYPKRVISFLRNILEYHGAPNQLDKYLSSLSEYKHPRMEELYEASRVAL